jgi:hypothetical protein
VKCIYRRRAEMIVADLRRFGTELTAEQIEIMVRILREQDLNPTPQGGAAHATRKPKK